MFGRLVMVTGIFGLSALAYGQNAVRPEALLPPDTLMYVGTDDIDAMRAAAADSPLGRIFGEEEVREFLEKPMAELKKLVDTGLAMAKNEPALAGVDLDPQKMMSAPFGRGFIAITSFSIPPDVKHDPSKLDLGFVFGLEPRGSLDAVGVLKQVLKSVATQRGGDKVMIDTITSNGVAIDRIRATGAPISLCFANVGGISVVSLSERAITDMALRAGGTQPSLLTSADYARGVAAIGAAGHGDVSMFVQTGRMLGFARQAIDIAASEAGGDAEAAQGIAVARALFDAMHFETMGIAYSVATRRQDGAVSMNYSEVNGGTVGGIGALMPHHPIDRELLKLVPKNALSFSIGHFDLAPLWDTVMGAIEKGSPEMHQKVMQGIHGAEMMVAGADEQGNPKWDIRRDLIGALAGATMSMSMPGAGSMLGPGGDSVFWIETPNPQGLETSMQHLLALPAKFANMPIAFKEQTYGDVQMHVLDPASLGQAAMLAGNLSLTWAIHDGKFWFATSTKALKKVLDSRTTPLAENITARADFATRFVEPPQGAQLTSLAYNDVAANFENNYTAVLGALPMVMMGLQQSGQGELPIDLSLLPTTEVISKHLHGSVDLSYAVGNGRVEVSRGPFGPEFTVGVIGGAMVVAGVVGWVQEQRGHAPGAGIEVGDTEVIEVSPSTPEGQVDADFARFGTAITVYMIEYGAPPAALDELVKAKPDYPDGFLDSKALPVDPWGHGYAYSTDGKEHYTIWSFGPNGVDDKGVGDDIVQKG